MNQAVLGWFKLGLYLLMGVFVSRLVFLTLVLGEYHEKMASSNRIRREKVEPLRGAMLDRNGEYLVVNKRVDGKIVRYYPLGEMAAGITGYVSEGASEGLESWYDDQLRGSLGLRLVEENALGEKIRELDREEAVEGRDLRLNVDADLQRQVYWAVNKGETLVKEAAVVVSKVNGEILAMVSLPSFDPNLFVKDGIRGEEGGVYTDVIGVVKDKDNKPLFNRVVSGVYPPGSVYKLVVAMAGLEEGVIDKNKTVEDKGEIKVGDFRFGNWYFDQYGRTEGQVNIEKALARSNDIYFYKLGEWLGVDRLVKWSDILGVGRQTGIDLPGEATGFLPTPLWREKRTGERWFLGNTYHLAIGQGDLLVTPLQVNVWTASVFSGKLCEPSLVGGRLDCKDLKVSKTTRDLVMAGMRQACMNGGTAFSFFDLDGKVYCKTGTAQHGGEEAEPHAWITVVVPKGKSENDWVVVTVLLPEGGEGSAAAGPVAREIVDYILQGRTL